MDGFNGTVRITRKPLDAGEPTTTDFVIVAAESDAEAALEAMLQTKLRFRNGEWVVLEEMRGPRARTIAEGRANMLLPMRLSERDREVIDYALRFAPTREVSEFAPEDFNEAEFEALADRFEKLPKVES